MKIDDSETRFEIVPYFHGKILDVSEGKVKTFPHFIGYQDARIEEPSKLGIFAALSLDAVVSSGIVQQMPYEEFIKCLTEWSRIVKDGGHILLHAPLGGEQWDVSRVKIVEAMYGLHRGWDCVESRALESGLLIVFKLLPKRERLFSCDTKRPGKTCAVVRLGAFGDVIQAASILPWLKDQGYHITMYVSDYGHEVVQHDPHVDRFIIQGKDEIPPQVLGVFWQHEAKKYDKWVNLSESVEVTLLPAPGSTAHEWPHEVRAKYLDRNYVEFTHEIAQVPPPYSPKFFSTLPEREAARFEKRKLGGRAILWSLSGSSVHKAWPHMDAVIASVLLDYDDVHVVLVGDELSKVLEAGWFKKLANGDVVDASPRVHCRSGRWTIRQSMAFAEVADLIIGTETGLLNAAGFMDTPKIVTLSHSSEEMLTKHWKNATALKQRSGCAKFPCRQLHYDWTYCMKHEETGTAVCQQAIGADEMYEAVRRVLGRPQRMVA